MAKVFLLVVVLTFGVLVEAGDSDGTESADQAESEEEPSLVGIFSGLLETLTETASSTTCPGQCVHTIRAFMCEHVVDGANCPGNLKCCTEHPPGPPRNITHPPHMRHPPWRHPPPQGQYPMQPPGQGQRYPPQNIQFAQPQHPPQQLPPQQYPTQLQQPHNREEVQVPPPEQLTTTTAQPTSTVQIQLVTHPVTQTTTTTTTPAQTFPPMTTTQAWNSNTTCPGVCVSSRMASSCEAIYKVPFACRNDLECCVTLDNFNADKPPTHLIRNEEQSPEDLEDDEVEEEMQIQERRPNHPPIRDNHPPIRENHPPIRENHPPIQNNRIREPQKPNFPPSETQQCPGTCITSFFTFFCEQVLDFPCPNEGKCCITQEKGEEQIPPQQNQQQQIPPQNQQQQIPPQQHCPRVCLPTHMAQACPKMLPYPCAQGFFCCVGPPVTQQQPPQQMTPPQRTPHPYQPTRSPSVAMTTSTTTTTEPPEELPLKPACPGSCINTILAFTCFRNAEITELFTCAKGGTKCCAPKTAIKEHLDSLKPKDSEDKREEENQKVGAEFGLSELAPVPNYVAEIPPQYGVNGPSTILGPPEMAPPDNLDLVGMSAPPPVPHPAPPPHSLIVLPQAKVQNSRSNYICGLKQGKSHLSRHRRVVGGSESVAGDWCWQVALINSLNQYLCGAALIGTQWVLTAAHCLTNIVRTGSTIYVRVGDHDLTSKYGSPSAQTLRVATTYIHHNHNSQTLDNDIALLKLQGQVELRQGVCLVCLPARGEGVRSGRRCTVTGYGYMGEAGPIPLRIREATLPIISDDDCIRQVNSVTEKRFVLPASSFCAGGEENKDACQGDGGGPLVCQDEGYYELTGLVSWGFGCGREDVPGVYVKVSSFIGWINQIISVNN